MWGIAELTCEMDLRVAMRNERGRLGFSNFSLPEPCLFRRPGQLSRRNQRHPMLKRRGRNDGMEGGERKTESGNQFGSRCDSMEASDNGTEGELKATCRLLTSFRKIGTWPRAGRRRRLRWRKNRRDRRGGGSRDRKKRKRGNRKKV